MTRAATSLLPPAAHATTMLTGRAGFQAAAGAAVGATVAFAASVGFGASVALGAVVAADGGGTGVAVGAGAQAELIRIVSTANEAMRNRMRGFILFFFSIDRSRFLTSLSYPGPSLIFVAFSPPVRSLKLPSHLPDFRIDNVLRSVPVEHVEYALRDHLA